MEKQEFNLRNYLYKNPLLEGEEKDVTDKARREAEEEGYEDGYNDAIKDAEKALDGIKDESEEEKDKKMDVKEAALRKAIQNEIVSILKEEETINEADYNSFLNDISTKMSELENKEHKPFLETIKKFVENKLKTLNEQEDVDVDVEKDVNIDVEDEVDVDKESEESDIEVKTEIPGEDTDTAAVLGLLTKAQDEASGMGDEVLMDQIGNTITYFTRKHVVKSGS